MKVRLVFTASVLGSNLESFHGVMQHPAAMLDVKEARRACLRRWSLFFKAFLWSGETNRINKAETSKLF